MKNSDAKGLKITFVHSKYSNVGGTEKYLYVISRELAKRGAEVDFFASSIETELLPGIKYHPVSAIKKPATAFLLSFLFNSSSALKKESYSIIQSSGKSAPAHIYRLGGGLHEDYLANKPDGKLNLNPYHSIVKKLERNIFGEKRFKKIISPSRRIKSLIMERYNVNGNDVEVLHNPVLEDVASEEDKKFLRSSFRKKYKIEDDNICYLFTAGNFRLKGLPELINAYATLPQNIKEKSRVIVAGGGRKSRYMDLLRKTGLVDKFIFTGKLTEGMNEVYSAGDVLVHPTYYDPFSNVCLEAMAYGLPVITTKINGFSEVIKNGIHGYIVSHPSDCAEISALMTELSDRNIRAKISDNCILKSKEFGIDNHIDRLIDIYREVSEKNAV